MRIAILGAGAAGLASAWLLKRQGIDVTVFEREPYVGGLARSFVWRDFTCDFATHRLFTNDAQVLQDLLALVPMARHTRRSRIWLHGKWLSDPVNIVELLYRYPSIVPGVVSSYLRRPRNSDQDSFRSHVMARYGAGLHDFFFAPYTEKLFGIEADNISAEWARRKVRIGGVTSFLRESSKKHFSYFYYPVRGGFGAIVNRFHDDLREEVLTEAPVHRLEHADGRVTTVVYRRHGQEVREEFTHVISTLPLPILGELIGRDFSLPYRGASAIYLLLDRPVFTEYHWLYFMDRSVIINRLAEFKNLSPVDQPPDRTVLCAEVTERLPHLVDRVVEDLCTTGLLAHEQVLDTLEMHYEYAYPVYDRRRESDQARVRCELGMLSNLFSIGRGATFEPWELDEAYAGAMQVTGRLMQDASAVQLSSADALPAKEVSLEETPLVYVVVLTYNNLADTLECLDSAREMSYPNFHMVVVDNGSTDGTPDAVRDQYQDVHVLENSANLGVPWGYNVGFAHALRQGAQYILMLNNDTVMEPDLLSQLVEAASHDPEAGILMPKVLYYDQPDRVWAIGGRHRRFPPAIVLVGRDQPDGDQFDQPRTLEYAPSCGLLIHRQAFERAGLFDPGYFFFFDDWDFSRRVRSRGLTIRYIPPARLFHKVGQTTGKGQSQFYWRVFGESSARFYRRHGQPAWLSLSFHIGYLIMREFILQRKWYGFKSFWSGVRAGLEKPLGAYPSWTDGVGSATSSLASESPHDPNE